MLACASNWLYIIVRSCVSVGSDQSYRGRNMPWDVKDVGFLAPDFVEFLAAFGTIVISFVILVILGKWWAR